MKFITTRMHSSRMRTGRTLTVFRCLVLGRGEIKKSKKNSTPKKLGGAPLTTPPQSPDPLKNWRTPQKNWRPPKKLETPWDQIPPGLTCKACWDTPSPGTDLQGMLGYPPGTDLQGMLGHPPPCGQTHACENITLAKTSFRPVNMEIKHWLIPKWTECFLCFLYAKAYPEIT